MNLIPSSLRRTAAAAILGAATLAAPVGAQELRFALGLPDTSPFHAPFAHFAEKLKEVGITAKVHDLSLLSLADVSKGVRDGLADAGLILFPYNPNEFSEGNLMATLSMLSTSGTPSDAPAAAMAGAVMEYIYFNCPECNDQIKAQNQVFISASSPQKYETLCRPGSHIETLADFQGKRIRAGGSNFARAADFFGATGVQMPAGEVYDALDKGVLDCIMISVSELITLRLIEVTDQVLHDWPGGVFAGQSYPGFNREIWQSLSQEQRAFILKAASEMAAEGVFSFAAGNQRGMEAANEKKMLMVQPNDEIKAKYAEFIASDLMTIKTEFETQYKLQNVDAKIATAQQLIDKWKVLTNGDLTEEKLAQIYWDEVLSKVDAATYGMD